MNALPKELWILVRPDGSMVRIVPEETEEEIRKRRRPDWNETIVGPYVLASTSVQPKEPT